MTPDEAKIHAAKLNGWYWGSADFGHGMREGWCKGPFAQEGFSATVSELPDYGTPTLEQIAAICANEMCGLFEIERKASILKWLREAVQPLQREVEELKASKEKVLATAAYQEHIGEQMAQLQSRLDQSEKARAEMKDMLTKCGENHFAIRDNIKQFQRCMSSTAGQDYIHKDDFRLLEIKRHEELKQLSSAEQDKKRLEAVERFSWVIERMRGTWQVWTPDMSLVIGRGESLSKAIDSAIQERNKHEPPKTNQS